MSSQITARENGDEYQRLVLWTYINNLIDEDSNIETICQEFGEIKGFDDIVIKYKKPWAMSGGEENRLIEKELIQVKYHQYQSGILTMDNLMSPQFINAKKKSFLERLRDAYNELGDDYQKCLFTLYTTFDIEKSKDSEDVLHEIVDNHSRRINVDKLFNKTGPAIRKRQKSIEKMLEHLNVEEAELKIILRQLRFFKGLPFPELMYKLNTEFKNNGLIPMSPLTVENKYVALARNWLANGKTELPKSFVIDECKAEGLFKAPEESKNEFVIESFGAKSYDIVDRNIPKLDLSENFEDGKYLKPESDWQSVLTEIRDFIRKNLKMEEANCVHFACSYAVTFLLGRALNSKAGYRVYPFQKTFEDGIVLWGPDGKNESNEFYEKLYTVDQKIINGEKREAALIVSMTHSIEEGVMKYIDKQKLDIGKVYHMCSTNIGKDSIKNGKQCRYISKSTAQLLNSRADEEKRSISHVFLAVPAAFIFELGRESLSMGRLAIYEHDMQCKRLETYEKSAVFPLENE